MQLSGWSRYVPTRLTAPSTNQRRSALAPVALSPGRASSDLPLSYVESPSTRQLYHLSFPLALRLAELPASLLPRPPAAPDDIEGDQLSTAQRPETQTHTYICPLNTCAEQLHSTDTMLVSLTVGKVDAGVTVLLTPDKRLVCSAMSHTCSTP